MELCEAKQRFFALRNGLLADTLRKQASDPHRMIFGLNLPQLREIAAEAGQDQALADLLWADADCRESRLLAPMVCPPESVRLQWLGQVCSPEEADVICHRLLRRQPGAMDSAVELFESTDDQLMRYAALRLLLNLMSGSAQVAVPLARQAADTPLTAGVARQILDY